jgi:HEAT repeat protein
LGHNGDRRALRSLTYLLHDTDAEVRQAACKGLGSLGQESAKHALFDVISLTMLD